MADGSLTPCQAGALPNHHKRKAAVPAAAAEDEADAERQELGLALASLVPRALRPADLARAPLHQGAATWGENLTFYAGCASWAAVGIHRGSTQSAKLRTSCALILCGAVGRTYGNWSGIIGLLFTWFESDVAKFHGADDWTGRTPWLQVWGLTCSTVQRPEIWTGKG